MPPAARWQALQQVTMGGIHTPADGMLQRQRERSSHELQTVRTSPAPIAHVNTVTEQCSVACCGTEHGMAGQYMWMDVHVLTWRTACKVPSADGVQRRARRPRRSPVVRGGRVGLAQSNARCGSDLGGHSSKAHVYTTDVCSGQHRAPVLQGLQHALQACSGSTAWLVWSLGTRRRRPCSAQSMVAAWRRCGRGPNIRFRL